MGCVKRIWYLSPMRAAKVQASLRIRAVSPEPPLLAHTSSESRGTLRQKTRSLALLNCWACAVKVYDGMLKDTNLLDAPQMIAVIFQKTYYFTFNNCGNVWSEMPSRCCNETGNVCFQSGCNYQWEIPIIQKHLLLLNRVSHVQKKNKKPEDHWSCIAHLIAEDMLKSAVTEEKKFKNIECKWFGPRSLTDLDLWYS